MADVVFQDEEARRTHFSNESRKAYSYITSLVLRTGLVKTQAAANVVMVVVAVIAFGLAWYISFSGSSIDEGAIYYEDFTDEERQMLPREILESFPRRGSN